MITDKIVEELRKYVKCYYTTCGDRECNGCKYNAWPDDTAKAIGLAAEILDKYRWHDLRKNPHDLPKDEERVLFYTKYYDDTCEFRYWTGTFKVYSCMGSAFENDDSECYMTRGCYRVHDVIAWRYIEPFEVEE